MKFRFSAAPRSAFGRRALLLACSTPPRPSSVQEEDRAAVGENYVLEIQYLWWKPDLIGSVTSDRLDLVGSRVDLVGDLGFRGTRGSATGGLRSSRAQAQDPMSSIRR
jgi:hypothetical protein